MLCLLSCSGTITPLPMMPGLWKHENDHEGIFILCDVSPMRDTSLLPCVFSSFGISFSNCVPPCVFYSTILTSHDVSALHLAF